MLYRYPLGAIFNKVPEQRLLFSQNAEKEFFYESSPSLPGSSVAGRTARAANDDDDDQDDDDVNIEKAKREGIILMLPTTEFQGSDKPIE